MPKQVEGLPMTRLQSAIQWKGMVRLHSLNEDDESLLCEWEWPAKSGNVYFACAATGLLFDKQSGRCLQGSSVELKLATVEKIEYKRGMFEKWKNDRIKAERVHLHIGKPGPKPKGYVEPTQDAFDECD